LIALFSKQIAPLEGCSFEFVDFRSNGTAAFASNHFPGSFHDITLFKDQGDKRLNSFQFD